MAVITLHRYFNDEALTLDTQDIKHMKSYTEEDDAQMHPFDPFPYTAIELKTDAVTSDGVGTAYVKETPEQIKALAAKPSP